MAELSANTLRYVDYVLARHTRYGYRLTTHNSQGSGEPLSERLFRACRPILPLSR